MAERPPAEGVSQEELNRQAVEAWAAELAAELDIDPQQVDTGLLLGLAGRAAHTVVRPAAPVSTFLIGYAAGLAQAAGHSPQEASRTATAVADRLLNRRRSAAEDSWAG